MTDFLIGVKLFGGIIAWLVLLIGGAVLITSTVPFSEDAKLGLAIAWVWALFCVTGWRMNRR